MDSIRNLRTTLGISQDKLAGFLGVSRSLLSMMETGQRNIPYDVLLKIKSLEASMLTAKPVVAERKSMDTAYAKELTIKIQQLECRLLKAQQSYLLLTKSLGIIEVWRSQFSDERSQLWLNMMEAETKYKLKTSDAKYQLKLQVQIEQYKSFLSQ
jgi:transcriptional regulator with XRE-family HTH domain